MRIFGSHRPAALIGIGVLAVAMTGCARYSANPQELQQNMASAQEINASGDSYQDTLVRQYRRLALYERDDMKDDHSANVYAQKAVKAEHLGDVTAESPQDWGVKKPDVQQGYARLKNAKANGAIKYAPVPLAVAQSRFDCWVEQLNEGYQPTHIARCREAFQRSMNQVERKVAEAQQQQQQKPTQQAAVTPTQPPKEEVLPFKLHFPFDQAALQPDQESTIEKIVQTIKTKHPDEVFIDGYADRAGPATYNQKLSKKRAENVRQALESRGVQNVQVRIKTAWHGENNPAVATADGVPNKFNRRVTISVQGRGISG